MTDYRNFEKHLETIRKKIYRDGGMQCHEGMIEFSFKQFVKSDKVKHALDIGFGTGFSLEQFKKEGIKVTGITVDQSEFQSANFLGHDVKVMDMNFLDFEDKSFDLIWCRHSLEHSVMPVISLMECERVLQDDGKLYVEVPSDNVLSIENMHHYSVMSDDAWQSLFRKAGFHLLFRGQYSLRNGMVPDYPFTDIYWYYWMDKEKVSL